MRGKMIWVFVIAMLVFPVMACAEDKKPKKEATPTSYDLPGEEAMEWRALNAEIRAAQAEATMIIQKLTEQRTSLLGEWKTRYKIKDLEAGWSVDAAKGVLTKDRNGQ